mmetsp:Transcript_22919/g.52503  ORF Transcript_22919/g.52503 Transcript_22919/m.52503 type:complete len:204 (-) Transcript_22919:9-620(-)
MNRQRLHFMCARQHVHDAVEAIPSARMNRQRRRFVHHDPFFVTSHYPKFIAHRRLVTMTYMHQLIAARKHGRVVDLAFVHQNATAFQRLAKVRRRIRLELVGEHVDGRASEPASLSERLEAVAVGSDALHAAFVAEHGVLPAVPSLRNLRRLVRAPSGFLLGRDTAPLRRELELASLRWTTVATRHNECERVSYEKRLGDTAI